jgi:glutamate formiminotransferase
MTPLIQCVPNFSEGQDADGIAAIVAAIETTPGIRVADWSADTDHHRMVVTFLGPPDAVRAASLAAANAAIAHIDLSKHHGVHPRLGAIDVLPFVPLRHITLDECAALARAVGQELARRHALPVFLYEAASGEKRSLPSVRKNAFQGLLPDFGPPMPHPTAGAVVVGARRPLIAYNVNLATQDIGIARQIARELREGGGAGFVGVRALGLALPSRGITQVSMNITRPGEISLWDLFSTICRRADALGTAAIGSEVIGALPGPSAFDVLGNALRCSLKPGQVLLENWPEGLGPDPV